MQASWAVLADDLSASGEELRSSGIQTVELLEELRILLTLARNTLDAVPRAAAEAPFPADEWDYALETLDEWADKPEAEVLAGPLDAVVESFYAIRNDFWPYVEALNEIRIDEARETELEPAPAS